MSERFKKRKQVQKNPEKYLSTDHVKADIKGHAVRGGAITVVAQALKQVVSIGSTVVLARLLTPEDFGLIAMVTAITGFIAMFKDMGLSMATVQRPEIDHGQVSTLFWINAALGVVTFLITVAVAPLITWYYGEPGLTWITISLAVGFLLGGLTVQHQALLRRQMRFKALAVIEVGSTIFGVLVAVVSAVLGATYWALVLMHLSTTLAVMIGIWWMCPWHPGKTQKISQVLPMLGFGGNITGFTLINYWARHLDNFLIGRFFGAQQLGFYSKAYGLLLLPLRQVNRPIAAVAIPVLSRLADSPQRYRAAYLRILEKITIITMPAVIFLIVTSDWLLLIVLGPQWNDASRIFSWLGISSLVQPIANTTGWLFITQDRTHHMFRWGLIGGTITIVSIVAGLPWGPVGVAASYSMCSLCVQVPLLFWFVGRAGPVRASDFYRTSTPAAFASLCVLVVLLAFRQWIEISSPIIGLSLCFAMTLLITLLILAVLPPGRLALRDLRSLLSLLYHRPTSSAT